ncbi:unnamed protein product [Allacma fusca]|uniref:Transporter n=1 Tax=Allacma fusca TaxID=39272 RepID=A0A8J2NTE2_9HEXA|nr:unnamed protein product [Allacma fusca]
MSDDNECVPMCSKSLVEQSNSVGNPEILGKDERNMSLEDPQFIPIILAKDSPTIVVTDESGPDKDGLEGAQEGDKLLGEYAIVQRDRDLTLNSLHTLGLLNGKNQNDWEYHIPSWNAFALSDPTAQLTVKSIASLGLGSSDGRNLYVRRVPSSASILINNKDARRPGAPSNNEPSEASSVFSSTDSGYSWVWKCLEIPVSCLQKMERERYYFVYRFLHVSLATGGGGAFLIPYFATLLLCSMPLLYMELSVGQFTRRGPVGAMERICPLFKGTGVASLIISFIMSTYSVVIIAWALYYLVESFNVELPWKGCGNKWNTENCWDPFNITAAQESTHHSNRSSVVQEFYDGKVLQRSAGIEAPGILRNELVLCLFCAWVLVYFALWKSVRSSGKVVYFTATFPYLLLIAFLVFSLTLPGADNGLRFFFKPRWESLLDAKVWVNAAAQNFNSVGLAMGSIMTFSSYNKFSNNILTDTIAITFTNAITSVLVGITVFAMLGNIALDQGTPVDDVVSDGPGLVFVVYPQVLIKMPVPHVWAVLFFFMLLCVALDNEFAMVEVVVTSIRDGFPRTMHKYFRRHEILVFAVCCVSFLVGLPNVMQGGIYIFQLIDDYAAKFSLMYLAFFETLAIVWIYGVPRLSRNIYEMTGSKPSLYFVFCWRFAAPALILLVWIFSFIDYEPPTYDNGKYKYPWWAEMFGWIIASCSLVTIPVYALIKIRQAQGATFLERLKNSARSTIIDCPLCKFTRSCTHDVDLDKDSEWNLHRNSIMTTNLTPVIMSEAVYEKVSTL